MQLLTQGIGECLSLTLVPQELGRMAELPLLSWCEFLWLSKVSGGGNGLSCSGLAELFFTQHLSQHIYLCGRRGSVCFQWVSFPFAVMKYHGKRHIKREGSYCTHSLRVQLSCGEELGDRSLRQLKSDVGAQHPGYKPREWVFPLQFT